MVLFKEVLPNPSGKDTEGEWIKIINSGTENISLSGWKLSDDSGKTFLLSKLKQNSQTISPEEELILPYSVTKISLNNNGDVLSLINNTGEIEDIISYTISVDEEELVFGREFAPKEIASQANLQNIGGIAQSGTILNNNINFSPIIIGVTLALVFGISTSILIKRVIEEK